MKVLLVFLFLSEKDGKQQERLKMGMSEIKHRLSSPYLKCLGPEVFQISDFFIF